MMSIQYQQIELVRTPDEQDMAQIIVETRELHLAGKRFIVLTMKKVRSISDIDISEAVIPEEQFKKI